MDQELLEALRITLGGWQGPVEPDLAVIFPRKPCGLRCFIVNVYDSELYTLGTLKLTR